MICIDAFKNLNIVNQNNSLSISPCCISPVRRVEHIDFENDINLNRIRNTWKESTFPTACGVCQRAEANNQPSRRQSTNKWYQDHGHDNTTVDLIRIDYWTGDTCNLRCAICTPENSSAWKEELKYVTPHLIDKKASINYFWKELDLSKLELIHLNGGEPLLNKEHINFLREIPKKEKVFVNYNTNGTVKPSQELLDLWAEFRLVQIDFSIDDIGQRYEYQRYPAKWPEVVENLQWFIDTCPPNCMFAVNTSVGLLNYHNLDNINEWLTKNFSLSRVLDPIEHRQSPVNGLFSLDDLALNRKNIVDFLNSCDSRRGTDWRVTFPELVNIV